MKVHSDNVVCASASEEVGDQGTGLSNPLSVANLGLKGRGLGGRLS